MEGKMSSNDGFEIVSIYTRAQAIADRVLVDVTATAQEMGIRYPVALTHAAWAKCVKAPVSTANVSAAERVRLWDVLWMFRGAARCASTDLTEIPFALYVGNDAAEMALVALKAVCGPGDNAEPVITIMLPEED